MPLTHSKNPPLTKGAIITDQWLLDFLKDGPRTVSEIRDAAREAHFLWATIRAARDHINACSVVVGVWAPLDDGGDAP